jgi:Rdx family
MQITCHGEIIWDRERDGDFPEVKILKQRVRDQLDPERSLGPPSADQDAWRSTLDDDRGAAPTSAGVIPVSLAANADALPSQWARAVPARVAGEVTAKTTSPWLL